MLLLKKNVLFLISLQISISVSINQFSIAHSPGEYELILKNLKKNEIYEEEFAQSEKSPIHKRYVDTTFKGKPKSRQQVWQRNFNRSENIYDQSPSLIALLNKLAVRYMHACIPVILYDKYVQENDALMLQELFQTFPTTFMHGKINSKYKVERQELLGYPDSKCRSYILFLSDVTMTRNIIGPQIEDKVIVVPRSTQWKLQEFLADALSSDIINLLVIGESYSSDRTKERPYVLYTHRLYTDGLGSNQPIVLTSWINRKFSRPHIEMFPPKLIQGFSGHRFLISAADQPPYVFKRKVQDRFGNVDVKWEGLEYRILQILGKKLNFTFDIVEPGSLVLGSGDAVTDDIRRRKADIGIGGIYTTAERVDGLDMAVAHSMDCAAFITLTSKALPRYRAIMGPFQWPVWVLLTFVYLIAIFPLAFSDRLSLRHLIGNYGEIENMFWYVFGTFTNSLTFSGQFSWSNSKKSSTRLLIGWYWMFTIIITACYTGSIIAFVTLPVFPQTVDTLEQLIDGYYRVGTLDHGGWERWFLNSTHEKTSKFLKNLEFVSTMDEGLGNVTKAFFWSYTFLGSKAQLEYIVQSNFTDSSIGKRSALHISNECFSIFGVSMIFQDFSVFAPRFTSTILRLQSSGLINKLLDEVSWTLQKSSSGRLLQASGGKPKPLTQEERGLSVADTEGMFLLLAIGFLVATSALISEWVGGCSNKCREVLKRRRDEEDNQSVDTNNESFLPNSSETRNDRKEEGLENPSSKSSTSDNKSLSSLSKETLQHLYDGPKRRHSTIVVMDGRMVVDSTITRRQVQSADISDTFMNELDEDFINNTHHVQINRPPTPYHRDIEDEFGEKIIEENEREQFLD